MARLLTPRVLRRGLEIFVLASLLGFGAVLFYSNNVGAFLAAIPHLKWPWLLVGLALASLDWLGSGLRLWLLARQIHPAPPFRGLVLAGGVGAWASYLTPLQSGNAPMAISTMRRYGIPVPQAPPCRGLVRAGGMGAWASYLTPLQSGNAPMTIYTMRRYGIPVPQAITLVLMSFIATVAFFGIAGPIAIAFGAGRSLGTHGVVLGISLYDLFLASLSLFVLLFGVLILVVIRPRALHAVLRGAIRFAGRRSRRIAPRS